jgi:hypothetical protein
MEKNGSLAGENTHRRGHLRQATRAAVLAAAWLGVGCGGTGLREHTATLLPSGKVLIVGDGTGAGAKVYDPSAGTFVATHVCTARKGHTATLLPDGKVLIAPRCAPPHLPRADETRILVSRRGEGAVARVPRLPRRFMPERSRSSCVGRIVVVMQAPAHKNR